MIDISLLCFSMHLYFFTIELFLKVFVKRNYKKKITKYLCSKIKPKKWHFC